MMEPEDYACQRVREALAADERVGELGVQVRMAAGKVFLTGQVATPERQQAIGSVATEVLPDYEVHNEVQVGTFDSADRAEKLS